MTRLGRRLRPAVLLLALALSHVTGPALAQQTLVVGNDRGGLVGERARLVDRLRQNGQRVEIRGNICYSSCTMYLGASNVCVSPKTTFGFHGPSRSGVALPPAQFETWSRLMASYYNAPLQQWFLQQGRYTINEIYEMSGSQLIQLGYRTC